MTPSERNSVRKVLLIDDDPDEHHIFRNALAELQPSCELQCIDQTFEIPSDGSFNVPDVAFVDINMPGENGFSWVRKLRALGYTFPVVMFTNSSREADRREAYAAGATLYLTKPAHYRQYVNALEPLLQSFGQAKQP